MLIRCIIVQRKCRYPGEFAPELVDAWSEYVMEDNLEGYAEVLKREQGYVGTEYDALRELDVEIPDAAIDRLFDIPIVKATAGSVGA